MKKLIAISALFLISAVAFAQQKPTTPPPAAPVDPNASAIKFETETIDYGDVVKGKDDGVRVFKFKNEGKSPLVINVQSTCGCTVPDYPKTEIMPGDKGEITVKYNMAPGRFSKAIKVNTNGNPQLVVLRIKGNVIDPNAPATVEQSKSMLNAQ